MTPRPAMRKREREQVVELLRCAADAPSLSDVVGFMPRRGTIADRCWNAKQAIQDDDSLPLNVRYPAGAFNATDLREGLRWLLLEAAARVEKGSWP